MRLRRTLLASAVASSLLLATACAGDDLASDDTGDSEGGGGGSVTVASQDFASASVVANMYQLVLEGAGYDVTLQLVGSRDVYMPNFPGDVDVVPEYTGAIANFLNIQANGPDAEPLSQTDPAEMIEAAQPLVEEADLTMLEPSEATDANAYFVTQEYAEEFDLATLSDLAGVGEPVVLAAAPDCEGRADCEGGLSEVYGIDITRVEPLGFASPQTYDAVISGEAQLGQTSTIDGSLESQGLFLLEDDQQIQPAQNLVPVVSTEFLEANPDVEDVLNELMATLTTDDMVDLTARVLVDRERAEDVAADYISEKGLG